MDLISAFSKSLTLPQSSYIKHSGEAIMGLEGYAKVIMIKEDLFVFYKSLLPSVHETGASQWL